MNDLVTNSINCTSYQKQQRTEPQQTEQQSATDWNNKRLKKSRLKHNQQVQYSLVVLQINWRILFAPSAILVNYYFHCNIQPDKNSFQISQVVNSVPIMKECFYLYQTVSVDWIHHCFTSLRKWNNKILGLSPSS